LIDCKIIVAGVPAQSAECRYLLSSFLAISRFSHTHMIHSTELDEMWHYAMPYFTWIGTMLWYLGFQNH